MIAYFSKPVMSDIEEKVPAANKATKHTNFWQTYSATNLVKKVKGKKCTCPEMKQ